MTRCLFVSDLHGSVTKYRALFQNILAERPQAVFIGGDFLPSVLGSSALPRGDNFTLSHLGDGLERLRNQLKTEYPRVFIIMGNDDVRSAEPDLLELAGAGLLEYIHSTQVVLGGFPIYGYSFVPPTPFLLKDWERYDVSRFVDPGHVSPEGVICSVDISERERRLATIKVDLDTLVADAYVDNAVFLFHAPPYGTLLDHADVTGTVIDGVALDTHVGSVAIRRFVEDKQPLLTLHGHIHESTRISGSWRDRIGRTHMFSAAHDGPDLAIVRFDLENLEQADRILV